MASKKAPPAPAAAPSDEALEGALVDDGADHDDDELEDDDELDLLGLLGGEPEAYELDLPSALEPLLNDVRAAVAAYGEREYGDGLLAQMPVEPRAPTPERLAADERLLAALTAHVERSRKADDDLDALDERCDELLYEWLDDVVFQLADAGKVDAAVGYAVRLSKRLANADEHLGNAAAMLANAGRRDEAVRYVDEVLSRFGRELSARDRMADVLARVGDGKRAEKLTLQVLEATEGAFDGEATGIESEERFALRMSALERAAQLAEARGDAAAARAHRAELQRVEQRVAGVSGLGAARQPEWGFEKNEYEVHVAPPPGPVEAVRTGQPKQGRGKR